MNDFEKSVLFAGFMTAMSELEEERKAREDLTASMRDTSVQDYPHFEPELKLNVPRQRQAIIELMEQFCNDTDAALGTESEDNDYGEWYDVILDSIGFNIVSNLPVSPEEKASVFDRFKALSGSQGLADGNLFFIYPNKETNSLYCDVDVRLLTTIAYASGHCKENNLIDFKNFMCELGEYIEYQLMKTFPNVGIVKNSIPKYIVVTLKAAVETAMDVMR